MQGELAEAAVRFDDVLAEAGADADVIHTYAGLLHLTHVRAYQGETIAARLAADAVVAIGAELGGALEGMSHLASTVAALAAGDVAAAEAANEAAWQHLSGPSDVVAIQQWRRAEAALGADDLVAARRWADQAVVATEGFHRGEALTTRARVAIAQGEPVQAERDAHDALATTIAFETWINVPGILECLARLAVDGGSRRAAARLLGAAEAIRRRFGLVRFQIHQAGYDATVAALRDTLGEDDFDEAWAEGAALSLQEAVAYARRGRGERKRPISGWESLTPTERDVVRLVSEGLANKDIATALFVSPRTVQSHLTHVYTKLGLTSRVQLVREAGRHV
jgi:DNA-binding CsgD family transcriptional regulator